MSEEGFRTFSGLNKLHSVDRLYFDGTDISFRLPNLRTLKSLIVARNDGLQTLKGLESLEQVQELKIRDNLALESLAGLSALSENNYFGISDNPQA